MTRKVIATFDANYGRQGRISIAQSECDICHQKAVCLVIDQSEGEYYDGAVCKPCVDASFAANERSTEEKS